MASQTYQHVAALLNDREGLENFAALNDVTVDAARRILAQLLDSPQFDERAKDYIFSDKSSDDVKAYVAGQEKAHKNGHEAGFAKGFATGAIALAALSATTWVMVNKK